MTVKGPLDHLGIPGEFFLVFRPEQIPGMNLKRPPFSKKGIFFLNIIIQGLSHGQRGVQSLLHRGIEPEGNGSGNKLDGKKEKDGGGQKGQHDKSNGQAGFYFRTQDVVFSLIVKFGKIPEDQQKKGKQ